MIAGIRGESGVRHCTSCSNRQLKAAGYALLAIGSRVGFFIVTPIWLDFFSGGNSTSMNNETNVAYISPDESYFSLLDAVSIQQGNTSYRSESAYFVVLGQWTFTAIIFGVSLLAILVFCPGKIRDDVERSYPKKNFIIIGCSQGVSSIFMAFAISGSRTPPYLQAILTNFALPIQFLIRFVVLRKRPTKLKALCALIVTLSEFVCLIPIIFPWLESDKQHKDEGGSKGLDRFLWPVFFVSSMVPFALANSIMERSVQTQEKTIQTETNGEVTDSSANSTSGLQQPSLSDTSQFQLNLVYFSFCWTVFVVLTLLSLFWVDLLPVIGTSSSISEFASKMWFGLRCLFGQADCSGVTALLGWIDFLTVLLGNFAFAGLMRFTEGANFVMIVMTTRTPLVFLVWTLFVEHPFSWQPHVSLSTWLSIGVIFVMVAAIVIYDRASKEDISSLERQPHDDDDQQPLVLSTDDDNYNEGRGNDDDGDDNEDGGDDEVRNIQTKTNRLRQQT